MESLGKVYILLLNWNSWSDTIECLESIFRMNYPSYQVIVCDNHSEDSSLEYIKSWADGRLSGYVSINSPLRNLSFPPVPKSISYTEYNRSQIVPEQNMVKSEASLILISNEINLGFAGGNNVGLSYIFLQNDFEYVWILNNDTVVKPDSLLPMVLRLKENCSAGICGSTLYCYDDPSKIQTRGGMIFNKWLGISTNINPKTSPAINSQEMVEKNISYISGASMLVTKQFLEKIGFLNEKYFLYFEEIDWITRARGKFLLAYSEKSVVYHKIGKSIGTSEDIMKKSPISDYYSFSSRIKYFRKYYPFRLPFIYLLSLLYIFHRLVHNRYQNAFYIIKSVLDIKIKSNS